MFIKESNAHHIVGLGDLRALSRAAGPGRVTDDNFVRQLRLFLTPGSGQPSDPSDAIHPRTQVLIPNNSLSDIAVIDRILNTSASDVYSFQTHKTLASKIYGCEDDSAARSSAVPRLRCVLKAQSRIERLRHTHTRQRRKAVRKARRAQDRLIDAAKMLVRTLYHDALHWHYFHLAQDRWREALCHRVPEISRYILQFDPPSEEMRDLQIDILGGHPGHLAAHGPLGNDRQPKKDSWLDAFGRLIPGIERFILRFEFNVPADSTLERAQTNIMLHILQNRASIS
ncbi:hypothetical protein PENSPDRAFT_694815 [Peniophora sp. CONT]|nr:hypothetical protein PENSPDRAFT_694815 [Peniophora sp. CONT]